MAERGHGPRAVGDPLGLDAAAPAPTARAPARAARAGRRPHQAQQGPAAALVRRGGAAGAGRVRRGARRDPAGPRAPARGRDLRAGRRRAPLARRQARGPGDACPRSSRTTTTRRRWRSRSSRTWPARTSTRSRRPARSPAWSRSWGSRARRSASSVGRSRVAISNLLRILDLPDEALELLEDGTLSEGHGRALLLAEDHADRRRLARAAADGAWSVRVTEEQAREANAAARRQDRRRRKAIHPDQAAAASEIADALGGALGTELKVKPRGHRLQGRARAASRSTTRWRWPSESAPARLRPRYTSAPPAGD